MADFRPPSSPRERLVDPLLHGPGGPDLYLGPLGMGNFRAGIVSEHRGTLQGPPGGGQLRLPPGTDAPARGLPPGSLSARHPGPAGCHRLPGSDGPGPAGQHATAPALCRLVLVLCQQLQHCLVPGISGRGGRGSHGPVTENDCLQRQRRRRHAPPRRLHGARDHGRSPDHCAAPGGISPRRDPDEHLQPDTTPPALPAEKRLAGGGGAAGEPQSRRPDCAGPPEGMGTDPCRGFQRQLSAAAVPGGGQPRGRQGSNPAAADGAPPAVPTPHAPFVAERQQQQQKEQYQ
mmetsp:Transcript_2554/g.6755  ORF Transcript_2554/g.6755 Transcript_2554/m.6755 type:complete len:289 (-) Transcript_2554:77-943(-)